MNLKNLHTDIAYSSVKLLIDTGSNISGLDKKMIKELEWDYKLNKAFPASHVEELTLASAHTNHVWSSSKKIMI